jgi:hypothetical protein
VLTQVNRNAGQPSLQTRSQSAEQYNKELSHIFDELLGYVGCTQKVDELQGIIANFLKSIGLDTSASASLAARITNGGSDGLATLVVLATVIAANTAVATFPTSMLHTVAVGTATGSAQNLLQSTHPAPACPQRVMQGSQPVNVVSVAMSLQSSNTISSDNAARDSYDAEVGTYSLGVQLSTVAGFKACFAGLQATGAATPSTYTGTIQLKRTLISCGVYHSSNVADSCTPTPRDDTSDPLHEDQDPQSGGSGGKVYDWDSPGVKNETSTNSVYRFRANYSEYAVVVVNGDTVSAAPVNYYVRLSCKFDGSGNPSLDTTVSGDNQVGMGTTPTTWNLQ